MKHKITAAAVGPNTTAPAPAPFPSCKAKHHCGCIHDADPVLREQYQAVKTYLAGCITERDKLRRALSAVRERCPGVYTTDQVTGQTFADRIDKVLE